MKIGTQTEYTIRAFGEKEGLRILKEAGYDYLDFSFFFCIDELDKMIAYEPVIREIAAYAKEQGIVFHQAHAPYPSSVDDDDEDFDNGEIFQMIAKAIEYASVLGIHTLIVHPKKHLPRKGNEEALYQMNMEFCQNLLPYCEKYNVRIALENVYQRDTDRECYVHGACADPEEFIRYLDSLPREWFVGCLDVGHCALVGEDIPNMIRKLGRDRLKALHIHDVDYKRDCHTLPGLQKLDFDAILKALAEIRYDGVLTLEADLFLKGFEPEFYPQATKFMCQRARFLADKLEKFIREEEK